VHGSQPIEGYPSSWSGLYGTSCARAHRQTSADVHETVARENKVAGSAHVCIDGIENEALLYLLDEAGVCASAASACASGAMEPSHVLGAMGVPNDRARGALRLTLGRTTTADDIARATTAIVESVQRLRKGRAA
jgi:cysteine desulfurase